MSLFDIFDSVIESVGDFVFDAVDAVAGVFDPVLNAMEENPIATMAAMAAAVASGGSSLAAVGDEAAYAAAAAEGAEAVSSFATVPWETVAADAGISLGGTGFTAPAGYSLNPFGETFVENRVGFSAPAGYSLLSGPNASSSFLASLVEGVKTVKTAVDTIQIVNRATRQKSLVPANAPIPSGWAVDGAWGATQLGAGSQFQYDPATGAVIMQTPTTPAQAVSPAVVPDSSPSSIPVPLILAGLGLVLYWANRHV